MKPIRDSFFVSITLTLVLVALVSLAAFTPGSIPLPNEGTNGQALITNGAGIYSWGSIIPSTASGVGDVTGPSSSTNLFFPQWSGTSGKLLGNGVPSSSWVPSSSASFLSIPNYLPSSSLPSSAVSSLNTLKGTISVVGSGTMTITSDTNTLYLNAAKHKGYYLLSAPHMIGTNTAMNTTTSDYRYGQAMFSFTSTADNYVVFNKLTVPEDLDTSADIVLERFNVTMDAAEASTQSFTISMQDVPPSSSANPATAYSVNFTITPPSTAYSIGALGQAANVLLTTWGTVLTPGHQWVIRVDRDGSDVSTATCHTNSMVIRYGKTQ